MDSLRIVLDIKRLMLQEIADKQCKQITIARTYALYLRHGQPDTDWGEVNRAIIARWSRSGLNRIKRMAWRAIETGVLPLSLIHI